jgi:hypothetical protein
MTLAGGALGMWLILAANVDARGQLEDVLRHGSYQRELPEAPPATPQPRRGWAGWPSGGARPPLLGGSEYLFFLLLAAAFVALLVAVILLTLRRHWSTGARPALTPDRPGARAPTARPPTDFERLADAGRYGEAVHALMLRALASLEPAPTPPLTAREALRAARLDSGRRADLQALVAEAERFWFAGECALRADFERCHDLWKRFVGGTDRGTA